MTVDQAWDRRRIEHGSAFHEHHVKADLQRGILFCPAHGIGCGCTRNHQAGRGNGSRPMSFDDGFVDRDCQAKIVPGQNQPFHG